ERPTVSPVRPRRLQRPNNRLSSAGEGGSKYYSHTPQAENSRFRKKIAVQCFYYYKQTLKKNILSHAFKHMQCETPSSGI
ncbi:hypothetical protein, partial [Ruegeria profundi]|uniref:hypothetical protein n=1 Tax=Ruegeria profundi TaxID=1685378 RepID=UPI001CD7F8A3